MTTETAAPVETLHVSIDVPEPPQTYDGYNAENGRQRYLAQQEQREARWEELTTAVRQFEPNKQFEYKSYGSISVNFNVPPDQSSDVITAMMALSNQWSGVTFKMSMCASDGRLRYEFRDGARRHHGYPKEDSYRHLPNSAWTKSKKVPNFSTTLAAVVEKRDDKASETDAKARWEAASKARYKVSMFTAEGDVVFLARNEQEARLMFEQWGTRTRLSRHGDGGEYEVKVAAVEEIPEKRVAVAKPVLVQ